MDRAEMLLKAERNHLVKVIDRCWGEGETSNDFADLLLDHMSYAQAKYLVEHDCTFNRYYDVATYADVVTEIISDEAFADDDSSDYIEEMEALSKKEESVQESELRKEGWIVGFGVALGVAMSEIKVEEEAV